MQDDLVERCEAAAGKAARKWSESTPKIRDELSMPQAIARSIIPIVLEEAAKVADMIVNEATESADKLALVKNKGDFERSVHAQYRGGREAGLEIAGAIRAKMENLT